MESHQLQHLVEAIDRQTDATKAIHSLIVRIVVWSALASVVAAVLATL